MTVCGKIQVFPDDWKQTIAIQLPMKGDLQITITENENAFKPKLTNQPCQIILYHESIKSCHIFLQ